MSQLNANVFFELGIRTALDKPVCLVVDDVTTSSRVPFDTNIVNFYEYSSSLHVGSVADEIPKLKDHIRESVENPHGRNATWMYFGIEAIAALNPADSGTDAKLDLIIKRLETIDSASTSRVPQVSPKVMAALLEIQKQLQVDPAGIDLLNLAAGLAPKEREVLGGFLAGLGLSSPPAFVEFKSSTGGGRTRSTGVSVSRKMTGGARSTGSGTTWQA